MHVCYRRCYAHHFIIVITNSITTITVIIIIIIIIIMFLVAIKEILPRVRLQICPALALPASNL